ncbi:MAG: hypothetical protein ACO39X_08245 [Candidatus Nanopelagicaceae bacterium]
MGLDTLAMVRKGARLVYMDESRFANVPNILGGGLFSGNGAGPSFRGKVYSDFIFKVTGESLYTEEMSKKSLERIVGILGIISEDSDRMNLMRLHRDPEINSVTPEEIKALYLWFKVVLDHDGIVVGWW